VVKAMILMIRWSWQWFDIPDNGDDVVDVVVVDDDDGDHDDGDDNVDKIMVHYILFHNNTL